MSVAAGDPSSRGGCLHDEYEDESMATKDEEVPYVCDKERFCRSFEWSAEIAWSAHQGIVAIDRNRRADRKSVV